MKDPVLVCPSESLYLVCTWGPDKVLILRTHALRFWLSRQTTTLKKHWLGLETTAQQSPYLDPRARRISVWVPM